MPWVRTPICSIMKSTGERIAGNRVAQSWFSTLRLETMGEHKPQTYTSSLRYQLRAAYPWVAHPDNKPRDRFIAHYAMCPNGFGLSP